MTKYLFGVGNDVRVFVLDDEVMKVLQANVCCMNYLCKVNMKMDYWWEDQICQM